MTIKLDKKDLAVLECLRENARLSTRKIAKKVNMPITTVHNRIRKLEKYEVIKNYTLNLNHEKLGKWAYAYILVSVTYNPLEGKIRDQEEVAREIKKLPGVEEVCTITGVSDALVKVRHKNMAELNEFLVKKLRKVKGVARTQTTIVLKSV